MERERKGWIDKREVKREKGGKRERERVDRQREIEREKGMDIDIVFKDLIIILLSSYYFLFY